MCKKNVEDAGDYRVIGDLSVTDYVMNNAFWIGVYPGLNDDKIEFMANVIKKACGRAV